METSIVFHPATMSTPTCWQEDAEFQVHIGSKKSTLVVSPSGHLVRVKAKSRKSEEETIVEDQIRSLKLSDTDRKKVDIAWEREGKRVTETIKFDSRADAQRFRESMAVAMAVDASTLSVKQERISLVTVTWNMGDTAPPDLLPGLLSEPKRLAKMRQVDLFVMACQECSHKPASGSTNDHVASVIQNTLGKHYYCVQMASMMTIRLFVFAHIEHESKISCVESSKEATGIAHVVGNKGGVGIRFLFHETSLCFVGAHLAAHQEKVENRNHDFMEILKGLDLGEKGVDSEHTFFMGDLNYRIDLPRDRVVELIEKEDWATLRNADQLISQVATDAAFAGYQEEVVNFRPTYRFLRGTNEYDEALGRVPSWCDRVLYKSLPGDVDKIIQGAYGSVDEIQTSDHHPVFATFQVDTLKGNVMHAPQKLSIMLTSLRGEDLVSKDSNGYSDPFVRFFGKFLEKSVKTPVQKKTLNPQWKDDQVPLLVPFITNEYLERCYLHFMIRDHDRASASDNMGQGSISLVGLFASERKHPVPFRCPVYLQGNPAGFLMGEFRLIRS